MKKAALLLVSLMALAYPATKQYEIVPYRNCISSAPGAPPYGISQSFINVVDDSLTKVSVWIGDTFTSEPYKVEVKDSATHVLLAHSQERQASQCWAWLDFPLLRDNPPVRGRTCKVIVTRPTGAAISYAYDPRESTYAYGCLSVGGTAHPGEDLAV